LSLYRNDVTAAARLDEQFAAEALSGRSFRHDVTEDDSVSHVWAQPEITNATSLVLIHNAAVEFQPKPLHLLAWNDFAANLDVALKGFWLCTVGVIRPMLKVGGGTVVSVLTGALSEPAPKGFAAYLSAKAALRALTQSLAAEYGARGLRTLSVSPGFMQTGLTDSWHPSLRDAAANSARPSNPTEVAARIRMLVEDPRLPARGETYDV
jgi:NAD(P)-dependent dehydrogenase (short-subunit alcohol dehydrogenase family)